MPNILVDTCIFDVLNITSYTSVYMIGCTIVAIMAIIRNKALVLTTSFAVAYAWLPSNTPLRGVNLGGQFVAEPWMMGGEWSLMGCAGQPDEWSCVKSLGQKKADDAFKGHWDRWITESDFDDIHSYGLNAVRIPTGYWLHEELVRDGEYFPKRGLNYLLKMCGWAADRGIYVIIEYEFS